MQKVAGLRPCCGKVFKFDPSHSMLNSYNGCSILGADGIVGSICLKSQVKLKMNHMTLHMCVSWALCRKIMVWEQMCVDVVAK